MKLFLLALVIMALAIGGVILAAQERAALPLADRISFYPSAMSRLSIGMTEPECAQVLGRPRFISADSTCRVLHYFAQGRTEYVLTFVDGKLAEYGRPGGFDDPPMAVATATANGCFLDTIMGVR